MMKTSSIRPSAIFSVNQDRLGYFELADGGTLFLDEIADRSAAAQATLLRVLETRSFRWVGGEKEMTVEVRVVGRHQQSAGGSG